MLRKLKKQTSGNSLVDQWLGLRAFTAEGSGSVAGWGAKIPQAVRRRQHTNKQTSTPPPPVFLFFCISTLKLYERNINEVSS